MMGEHDDWVEKETRRLRRWELVARAWHWFLMVAAGAAVLGFELYREWVIWSR